MKTTIIALLVAFSAMCFFGCTKLEEKYDGDLTADQVGSSSESNTAALLEGAYRSLQGTFTFYFEVFALSELTTDEAIAPTRGPDWDDNGDWRLLHQHKWSGGHIRIRDVFNNLSGAVYAATDLLKYKPSAQEEAEARFIRAWAMYWLLDLYDQVPYREPGESVIVPSKVRKGMEAFDYIISELNAILPQLPDRPPYKANKSAAKALLMKCYLNKAVYENRAAPSFSADDMNKVVDLADDIINSNIFLFSADYFDNFSPDNTAIGKENIFTSLNTGGVDGQSSLALTRLIVLHGAQGGWNGWTTLADFYNKFPENDKRRGEAYATPGSPPNPGHRITTGFLEGQQYDLTTDEPLTYGSANKPLIYTPAVKNIETGADLETTGIRALKYGWDYINPYAYDNDYVYLRLADELLMKAEAILRGATPTNAGSYGNSALAIVNAVRTSPSRGAPALTSIDLNELLDERGRELWWEGWRRQDMIRFGKFLLPFQEKNYTSDPRNLVFPIPNEQLAVNPNYTQNPGY